MKTLVIAIMLIMLACPAHAEEQTSWDMAIEALKAESTVQPDIHLAAKSDRGWIQGCFPLDANKSSLSDRVLCFLNRYKIVFGIDDELVLSSETVGKGKNTILRYINRRFKERNTDTSLTITVCTNEKQEIISIIKWEMDWDM